MSKNLLLVLAFPDDEPYLNETVDAETLADSIVAMLNEERRRNADDAGRPDYYTPLEVNGIPGPQWVDGEGLAILVRAVRLVQDAQAPLAKDGTQ